MASPNLLYYCPCFQTTPEPNEEPQPPPPPPPPHLPSSSYRFHPLHTLFFCEECDTIRCNRCVNVEVSSYYCPNCLFEVPSASVRAEKNRCARNCFMCPLCRNTLSVVPSDPPDSGDGRLAASSTSSNDQHYFLYCNYCRWDSAEVGITFEKPTGLAAQLQKFEDSAPDSLEFERLKEHFEPFIRASSLSSSTSAHHAVPGSAAHSHTLHSTITAAASAALARDVPGVGKYNALARSTSGRGGSAKDRSINRDEMPEYRSRLDVASASARGSGGGTADVEYMRHIQDINEVAALEQRWGNSWVTPLQAHELRPLRIPLHSKRSKRCPTCTHILIKPEQKAQSVRYKIKLSAANYLPSITTALPHAQRYKTELAKRTILAKTALQPEDDRTSPAGLHAGKTYQFQLAFSNPLYDPIQVALHTPRVHASATTESASPEKARRTPYTIALPTTAFTVAPFAEAWEYEDDEDMFAEEDESPYPRVGGSGKEGEGKAKKTVGVLEKKANVTVVGGEVMIGREARGHIRFNMLVKYNYRADEGAPSESNEGEGHSSAPAAQPGQIKKFFFYTMVDLGPIIPRQPKLEAVEA